MRRSLLTAAAGALLVTGGCGGGIKAKLAEVRDSDVPLYYAGDSFAGLPLTHVETYGRGNALFVYGNCTPSGDDGGCAPPIEIQIFPFKPAQWRLAGGCRRLPRLLGVPTARHDGLVLFTRRTVVKIYARSHAEDRRVALALRRVGEDAPVRRLPAPDRSVEELEATACPKQGSSLIPPDLRGRKAPSGAHKRVGE